MSSFNGTPKSLRIGVLYEQVQLSDITGLDILGSMSTRVFNLVSQILPNIVPLKPYAIDMEFLYISSSLDLAWATPEMYIKPTHTYENAPRDLDILLLGGPDPSAVSEASLTFLQEASKQTKVILSTCSGGMWLARSGILNRKKATTNRMLLDAVKHMFPKVEWQDQRWVIEDGHFEGAQVWTAGGAGCGIDMIVEYALQNFHEKLVALACQGLDFEIEGRRQAYSGPFAPVMGS